MGIIKSFLYGASMIGSAASVALGISSIFFGMPAMSKAAALATIAYGVGSAALTELTLGDKENEPGLAN